MAARQSARRGDTRLDHNMMTMKEETNRARRMFRNAPTLEQRWLDVHNDEITTKMLEAEKSREEEGRNSLQNFLLDH